MAGIGNGWQNGKTKIETATFRRIKSQNYLKRYELSSSLNQNWGVLGV